MEHPGIQAEFIFDPAPKVSALELGEWLVYNASGEDIPAHSLAEITGFCNSAGGAGNNFWKINKPSANGLTNFLVIEHPIGSGKVGVGTLDDRFGGLVIQYDKTDGDPIVGGTLGTKTGSWKGTKNQAGLVVMGANISGTDPTGQRAFCIRSGAGRGFSVAQATADGSGGTVTVKLIQFKADVSASPNFEQIGDGFSAKYFKL